MRVQDWEQRLARMIAAGSDRAFAWGVHDCATWSADVVADLTGAPSMADAWRGRYGTARGADLLIAGMGFASLAAAVTARLGPPLPGPRFAQRGDVLLHQDGAIGICVGAGGAFVGADGLAVRPIADCQAAWRV